MKSQDPLRQSASNPERELFDKFSQVARGFPYKVVIGAALNIVLNAMRQANATRKEALADYDEITARTKTVLADHYDALGKRRNVFPFTQHIVIPKSDFSG